MILSEVNLTNTFHIFIAVITANQNNILGNRPDNLAHLKYILIHGLMIIIYWF